MEILVISNAAKVAHDANRSYCQTLGDFSQEPWETAPEWQRRSAIAGVEAIVANSKLTPEQSHESWMRMKLDDGWIYSEVKDANKKTHPCLIEYQELPIEQRKKDSIFGAVVRACLGIN